MFDVEDLVTVGAKNETLSCVPSRLAYIRGKLWTGLALIENDI